MCQADFPFLVPATKGKYMELKMLKGRSDVYSHNPTEMRFQKRLAVSFFSLAALNICQPSILPTRRPSWWWIKKLLSQDCPISWIPRYAKCLLSLSLFNQMPWVFPGMLPSFSLRFPISFRFDKGENTLLLKGTKLEDFFCIFSSSWWREAILFNSPCMSSFRKFLCCWRQNSLEG